MEAPFAEHTKARYLAILCETLQGAPKTPVLGTTADTESVLRLLHQHFLGSRFFRLFQAADLISELPRGLVESVRNDALYSVQQHAAARLQVLELADSFGRRGVPIVFLKGWLLAQRLYEFPEERFFKDIDILLPPDSRRVATEIFTRAGFLEILEDLKFSANRHKISFKPSTPRGFEVECHFGLGYGSHKKADYWDRLGAYRTPSGDSLLHLGALDEYLYLLFHGGRQHRFQRLGWLLDLAQFHRKGLIDSGAIAAAASRLGLAKCWEVTAYFLMRHAGTKLGNTAFPPEPCWDKWFEKIACFEVEGSLRNRLGVRRLFADAGMASVLRYGLSHAVAQVKNQISSRLPRFRSD